MKYVACFCCSKKSLASTGTQRQPYQTEVSVALFLWIMILNIFKTPTTSTIERIVIMCTMICSFTTISNLTQLLLWRLTRPCSSDHQHKLPKHVWRTLFSKNCLNYCMVHARAPFPASSELLENIVIATGTQSFLTTWWFASPLCGLITTIKMRLEHQCFTQEEIQDQLDWHKCKGEKWNLYRV